MVVLAAAMLGVFGLVLAVGYGYQLLWLHRMRKASDVTGTVVARDRQFTGRSNWTYPVVEYTTRDGTQIRRTFQQSPVPPSAASCGLSMTRALRTAGSHRPGRACPLCRRNR